MIPDLELKTRIAILEKDLERANTRTAVAEGKLEQSREGLREVIGMMLNEVGNR